MKLLREARSGPVADRATRGRKTGGGDSMSIRQKIERLLDKLPEEKLKRIYELVKYIYICT